MGLLLCEYITDKLIKNLYSFGFFAVGVILGILLVLLVYKIFTKTQAKPLKLKKKFEEDDLLNDEIEKEGVALIRGLETKQSIDSYAMQSLNILIQTLKKIACVYTDNKHTVELNLEGLQEKYPYLSLSFDTDITIENALKFIAESGVIIENTLLETVDSYSTLASTFLRFLGFKGNVRDITVKDIVLYLNKKADKKNKSLEKKEAKLLKESEKQEEKKRKQLEKEKLEEEREKEKRKAEKKKDHRNKKGSDKKENNPNWLSNLFKRKPKEEKDNKEENFDKKEKIDISAYDKPVNKVLREIFIRLIFSLGGEVKRLYGDGFVNASEGEQKLIEEQGIEEALKQIEYTESEEVEE